MNSVAVVLPYYNRQDSLSKAAQSVLNQTHEDLTLILVNDGSTDESREVAREVRDPRVQHVDADRNMGPTAARNLGLKATKSRLVAFMDSDDEWLPMKLERQLDALQQWHDKGLNVSIVGCGWRNVGSAKQKEFDPGPFNFQDMLSGIAGTGTPMLLIDRGVASPDVKFDVRFPALVERDYILSCLRNGSLVGIVPEVLAVVTRGRNDHVAHPKRAARAWELYLEKYHAELEQENELHSWYSFRASREYLVARDHRSACRHVMPALKHKPVRRGIHLVLGAVAGAKGFAVAQRLKLQA